MLASNFQTLPDFIKMCGVFISFSVDYVYELKDPPIETRSLVISVAASANNQSVTDFEQMQGRKAKS